MWRKYKLISFAVPFFLCLPFTLAAQTYDELSGQAVACIGKDSLHRAEALLLEALKLEPMNSKNALLFSNLGWVQRRLGKPDKALESYSFALNFASSAVPVLLDRAAIYMERGENDRAYTDYCQVLDNDSRNKEALLMRAYIYMRRRDYATARIDYNRLLEIEPLSYSGRLGLATLEQNEGRFRESIGILNKMIAEKPGDATLYVARAGVEYDMGHEELALVDLDEAIRLDDSLVDAYLLRGSIYLARKKKAAAKADFERSIALGVPPSDLYEQLRQCR